MSDFVNKAVAEVKNNLPQTEKEARAKWNRLFRAVREDTELTFLKPDMMDELKKYTGGNSQCLILFFKNHGVLDIEHRFNETIARDNMGKVFSYGRNENGVYVEFYTVNGVIRIGYTDVIDGTIHLFYEIKDDVYLDYYLSGMYGDGPIRQSRTRAVGGWNTMYHDENGDSTIVSNVKGFVKDFINIFK